MAIKKTSFNVDEELMNNLKIMAIKRGLKQSQLIEEYIKLGLEKDKEFTKE